MGIPTFSSKVAVRPAQMLGNLVYASEADILNMALFGVTVKIWRDAVLS
jgi:hypothetical protein